MKILIVCSGNNNRISPFVAEQVTSLQKKGLYLDYYLIKGKGVLGYLKNLPKLKKQLKNTKYDLIHAMFGLSGMLAVLQRTCPVVITFQGCDINRRDLRIISKLAMKLARYSIFVDDKLAKKAKIRNKFSNIPYGIDFKNSFFPLDKQKCRRLLNLDLNAKIALFSSSFDRVEKNYQLARKAVECFDNLTLIKLSKNYKRHENNLLYNACDLLLMTSIREGSPQVIKEAMACNCPIVSTDVGDVKEMIKGTEGCYITSYEPVDVADKIKKALDFGGRTKGREKIQSLSLDSDSIAKKIIVLYKKIIK